MRAAVEILLRRLEVDPFQQFQGGAPGVATRPAALPWIRSGRPRWWAILWNGFSEANGSWNTICTPARYRCSAAPRRPIG